MPKSKKKVRELAPAPSPSSAMAFSSFFLLLAIAGLALQGRDLSNIGASGALIAPERPVVVGEGYGVTCSQIVTTTMEVNDCCTMMCKPYAKTDSYAGCWASCYKRGLKELSVII
ncbi:MAG: hypothetical protein AABX47_07800 [Nanoarchaeota archaeon]